MPQKDNSRTVHLSTVNVDPKTKKIWEQYLEQNRGKPLTFQQVIIHCHEDPDFDVATARREWEAAK